MGMRKCLYLFYSYEHTERIGNGWDGGGGKVGHHAPLLSFLTAPLKQLLVLSALYGKLPAMFGDHFPILILIQGSLV